MNLYCNTGSAHAGAIAIGSIPRLHLQDDVCVVSVQRVAAALGRTFVSLDEVIEFASEYRDVIQMLDAIYLDTLKPAASRVN